MSDAIYAKTMGALACVLVSIESFSMATGGGNPQLFTEHLWVWVLIGIGWLYNAYAVATS